jgi:hypothetical protein
MTSFTEVRATAKEQDRSKPWTINDRVMKNIEHP